MPPLIGEGWLVIRNLNWGVWWLQCFWVVWRLQCFWVVWRLKCFWGVWTLKCFSGCMEAKMWSRDQIPSELSAAGAKRGVRSVPQWEIYLSELYQWEPYPLDVYKGPLNYCFKLLNKDDGMHFSLFGLHLTVTASQDYEYDTDSTTVTCQSCYSL